MLQSTQAEVSAEAIDLALGHPAVPLLPLDLLRTASEELLEGEDRSFLQYGYENGFGPFRSALADFLSAHYAVPVSPEELFVSNGVSQALDLICTRFTRPGDTVLVEEPTYFLALRIFADHGLEVIGLPTDPNGLVVDALQEHLDRRKKTDRMPAFLYAVPTYQNPSGATLSLDRRNRLLELSREHGLPIVADEVYHLLSYDAPPPPPFGSCASAASVFSEACAEAPVYSLGSFSKILAPGLRLGWVQASPKRLEPLAGCGMLDSGGGLNPFTSALVAAALRLGLEDVHLGRIRRAYRQKMEAMDAALTELPAERCRFRRPGGGFFYWIELADGRDAEELLEPAAEQGVRFLPGSRFSSRRGLQSFLRLSFSYYDPDGIREGVRRLAVALQRS